MAHSDTSVPTKYPSHLKRKIKRKREVWTVEESKRGERANRRSEIRGRPGESRLPWRVAGAGFSRTRESKRDSLTEKGRRAESICPRWEGENLLSRGSPLLPPSCSRSAYESNQNPISSRCPRRRDEFHGLEACELLFRRRLFMHAQKRRGNTRAFCASRYWNSQARTGWKRIFE